MNIEETGYIDTVSRDGGPLCPRSHEPAAAPEHVAVVRVQNAMYAALPRDPETDEFAAEDANRLFNEASYGYAASSNMRTYRVTASVTSRRHGYVTVEAVYFQCGVCGFILPARVVPPASAHA